MRQLGQFSTGDQTAFSIYIYLCDMKETINNSFFTLHQKIVEDCLSFFMIWQQNSVTQFLEVSKEYMEFFPILFPCLIFGTLYKAWYHTSNTLGFNHGLLNVNWFFNTNRSQNIFYKQQWLDSYSTLSKKNILWLNIGYESKFSLEHMIYFIKGHKEGRC